MESIEAKIKAFLSGEVKDPEKEFLNIDYSLDTQNFELSTRGVEPKSPSEFKPKIGASITFVVAAVIFNEKNEILMIQEAQACAGHWYLPAGRVEPNETFEDAVKREVVQESGLDFEPSTLLVVESSHGTWFRFVYTGEVVGGQLKTVAKADQESLQASYIADITKLSLRSQDCLKLIDLGREYLKHKHEWHSPQLVIHRQPVPNIFLRLLIAIRSRQSNSYSVLISDSLIPHIPICEINPARSVHASLKRFMQHIFGVDRLPHHKPIGILTVEHNAASQVDQYDGLCLTLLVICKDPLEAVHSKTGFSWRQLDSNLETLLVAKLSSKYKTITLSVFALYPNRTSCCAI